MMKKRNLLLGLSAVMSLAMLTGCSSGNRKTAASRGGKWRRKN